MVVEERCEILAPAGTKASFIAAVENGADAVYIGGTLFNARINADNFSLSEIEEASIYAHKRGVRVYVTLNTLIEDGELAKALAYAWDLYRRGVDALIIQDAGLGQLIRKEIPDFPIHLSTQGTVYSLDGVKYAEEQGYDRVVLARELSFDEIKEIAQNTELELEVFCHGALCICYSGQCQMSRYIGGRSGNRGECAQPCRLPYSGYDSKGERRGDTYPLSPSDFCLIDHIGELAEAGVKSLKIEGRMKSPEYVATVTSIYRKYLDLYYKDGSYEVSDEDRYALKQIFNRGGFTEGYFNGKSGPDFMSGRVPKHYGVEIGHVVKPEGGRDLVDIRLTEEYAKGKGEFAFRQGDGIEIGERRIAGNVVTYFKPIGDNRFRIGDIKKKTGVIKGAPVYRITSRSQLDKAAESFKNKDFRKGPFIKKTPVEIAVKITKDGRIRAEAIWEGPIGKIKVDVESLEFKKAEEARNLTQRFKDAFSKTGSTPFYPRNIYVEDGTEACLFDIPMSGINGVRRKLLSGLEDRIEDLTIRNEEERSESEFEEIVKRFTEGNIEVEGGKVIELYFTSSADFESFVPSKKLLEIASGDCEIRAIIPATAFSQRELTIPTKGEIAIIPAVGNVTRGEEDRILEENFDIFVKNTKEISKGMVYTGNTAWIKRLKEAGLDVYGDYGLNIYNEASEKVFSEMGLAGFVPSSEKAIGVFPLMTSERDFGFVKLSGIKGKTFRVFKKEKSDQSVIIADRSRADGEREITKALKALEDGKLRYRRIYI